MKKKISKSDMEHKDFEITDEIKISSLKSQVKYWKTRYELLLKYGIDKDDNEKEI